METKFTSIINTHYIIYIISMHSSIGYGESMLNLLWPYYCQHLALPSVPDHVLQCYHAHFTVLPWQQYVPDLPAMDLMIKVSNKMIERQKI